MDTDQLRYVPAAAGFEVLTHLPDDKTYYTRPVVAWAIITDADAFVRAFPLTPGESFSLNIDPVVCLPSGEVVCGDLEWDSLSDWLTHMNENGAPRVHNGRLTPEQSAAPILALDAFRHKMRGGDNGF